MRALDRLAGLCASLVLTLAFAGQAWGEYCRICTETDGYYNCIAWDASYGYSYCRVGSDEEGGYCSVNNSKGVCGSARASDGVLATGLVAVAVTGERGVPFEAANGSLLYRRACDAAVVEATFTTAAAHRARLDTRTFSI